MMRWSTLALLGLGLSLLSPLPSYAQQRSVADILSFLLTNQAVSTGDPAKDAQAATVSRDTITASLTGELASLPVMSSSPGLIYRLDPTLGTLTRASDTFGPFFTERTLTAGKYQASFGVSTRVEHFNSLDGNDLRNGTFLTSANQFRDEQQPFDTETLTLNLELRTLELFTNVGLTDRLDIGAALPFESISLSGERREVYRGQPLLQASASAHATGFGDLALRAKYKFIDQEEMIPSFATVVEARVPTGDETNLLGAGKASIRAVAISSLDAGRISAHANLGALFGGLSSELQYRGSVDLAAAPRVSIIGELVGRRLADVGRIITTRTPNPTIDGVDTIRLESDGGSSHSAAAVAGVKWNIAGTWLLGASVAFPLTDTGLRSRVIAQIGLDYAFAP
jgi:Putative MetA-pathway of phenol degradation